MFTRIGQTRFWIFLFWAFVLSVGQGNALTLDAGFGDQGVVTTRVGHVADTAHAILVQPDGKILAAGSSSNSRNLDFALVRYMPDGELDPSFHFNGQVVTVVGSEDDAALDMALQGDGKIIVCGYAFNGEDRDFAMVRFTADGVLDREFGDNGMVVAQLGAGNDQATAVAIQADGKILVAGTVEGTAESVGAVVRFQPNGSVDASFGQGGAIFLDAGADTAITDMAVQKDLRIVLAGSYEEDGRKQVLLARRQSNGLPDTHFNGVGVAEAIGENRDAVAHALTALEDGTIMVVGSAGLDQKQDVLLVRYTADGRLDHSFGDSSGMLIHDFKGDADVAYGVAANAQTLFVAGSTTGNALQESFLLQYPLAPQQPAASLAQPVETESKSFTGAAYSLALQEDGKVVLAGVNDDGGTSSFALAQYATGEENPTVDANAAFVSPFIFTTPASEITRVGAFTGGTISPDSGLTFSRRGVVYSIAPYPSLSLQTVITPLEETGSTVIPEPKTALDPTKEGSTSNGSGSGVFGSILSGLSPGTHYFVRAYGVASTGVVYYGQQLSFTTSDACFIATAAYGSLLDPHVQTLRLFRDSYLLTHETGRAFVRLYYQHSPAIAVVVANHPVLRFGVRTILLPVVAASYLLLHPGIMGMVAGGGFILVGGLMLVRRRSRFSLPIVNS